MPLFKKGSDDNIQIPERDTVDKSQTNKVALKGM
jgi:hypothetical protein